MPRLALIACLVCCLLVMGCASQRQCLPSGDCPIPWLENHPVAKVCATAAAVEAVIGVVLAV